MSEKNWIAFTDGAVEDTRPTIDVEKTSKQLVTTQMADAGQRTSLTVRFTTTGAWEGTVSGFQKITIPETTLTEQEGAPGVPKDGIFVAVPMDAEEVEVRTVDKAAVTLDHEVNLAPAPKQFVEEEFQEVFEQDPEIYESDEAYPGVDFDFLGLKTISGVRVAHILVFLGQYRPRSRTLELVQSLTLEVSYQTPPAADRQPGRRPRERAEADLIVGLDLLDSESDYSSAVEDLSGVDREVVEEMEEASDPSLFGPTGLSQLEGTEEEASDPEGPLPFRAERAEIVGPIAVLPIRPALKIPGLIAEFVIITTRAPQTAVGPLLTAKSGWPFFAKVALTADIQSEFPAGTLKDSIKEFITWATDNWRVPPRFVVLAGDSDVIPIHIYNRGGMTYASDHFYADISGDLVPELTVSRIPTSDAGEMKSVCEHLARYGKCRNGDWGGWQNRVMLCAYQSSTYETTCDEIEDKIKKRYSVTKRYAKDTTRADVVKTMDGGVLIALYRGHGSKTAWSSSNGLRCSDVEDLKNGSRPPFVLSVCCQNGWVDDNTLETIAETFVRERKSVAVFASSRNSWTYPNNDFAKYMFDAVMTGKSQTPAAIIGMPRPKWSGTMAPPACTSTTRSCTTCLGTPLPTWQAIPSG